jgi:pyruvate dehydrogenase E1 component beta subunit
MFMEQLMMYNDKGEVPDEEYTIPLGKADIKRAGKDVTLLTWSLPVHFSLAASEILAKEGIDVEVVDLRTIVPLDWEAIVESVKKTNRVIIVEYGVKRGGVGAELSAKLTEELFYELDTPIVRLASANIVAPYCPVLEDHIRPNRDKVVEAVREMMK